MAMTTLKEAMEAVLFRCEQRLRHLGNVKVEPFDHDWFLGVMLSLHDREGVWRHAVRGESNDAMADPVAFADTVADKLLEWHARRGA
jgi:hypothetical protein